MRFVFAWRFPLDWSFVEWDLAGSRLVELGRIAGRAGKTVLDDLLLLA
jgi:hypothetical protein